MKKLTNAVGAAMHELVVELLWLIHMVVIHPISGILAFLRFKRTAEVVHNFMLPPDEATDEERLEEAYPLLDFFSPEEQITAEHRRHTCIAEDFAWPKPASAVEIDRLEPILFASAANLDRLGTAAAEVVATATCKETGKVIPLYEGNFVDGPGNGAEVDWDHVIASSGIMD